MAIPVGTVTTLTLSLRLIRFSHVGGGYYNDSDAGSFDFGYMGGYADYRYGFRAVLVAE